jgi:hypothetical protein
MQQKEHSEKGNQPRREQPRAPMPPREGESERQRQPGPARPQHHGSETERHGDDTGDEYSEDRQSFRDDEDDESDEDSR